VTSAGNAVGTDPVVAHAIWAHGRSQPMQPSNAMATGPRRSQIATSTIPKTTRLLMTSPTLGDARRPVKDSVGAGQHALTRRRRTPSIDLTEC